MKEKSTDKDGTINDILVVKVRDNNVVGALFELRKRIRNQTRIGNLSTYYRKQRRDDR